MVRLKPRQRAVLLEKLPDVANLGIGALLFGQFVANQTFSAWSAIAGFAIWIGFMGISLWIAGDDQK